MKIHPLVIAILMLMTLTDPSISSAQSNVQNQSADGAFTAEPITLETPTATLYRTLVRPHSRSSMPVVLIIAGSGPTDRDGNSPLLKGPNNSLKLLAEGLAAHGIASLRYDKRGIGETGKAMQLAGEKAKIALREEDLSFENYIDDAVRWGKQLRPAVPPIEGLKEAGFITNEEVFQLKKLPETLIVLGGGPIGLELGQSFARFGSKVTVVEMDRRLLAKEDEEVSATVEEIMRADGLRFC